MFSLHSPENVPRLYDLVRMKDAKYAGSLYYALGNTLVAKDLDQATRIGLQGSKRHRVVTLNGQLIEATGKTTEQKILLMLSKNVQRFNIKGTGHLW